MGMPPTIHHITLRMAARHPPGEPVGYVGAEGPEGHARQLEGLEPERYAYDGNHHGEAGDDIFDRDHETAEYDPDYVEEKIHSRQEGLLPQS